MVRRKAGRVLAVTGWIVMWDGSGMLARKGFEGEAGLGCGRDASPRVR